MTIIRREFIRLSGTAGALAFLSKMGLAQAPTGPRLTQILRKDLDGQDHVVCETVVSLAEFGPGSSAPWHMHPGAQELLHVIEGNLTIEIEGKDTATVPSGEARIIAADRVHLVRNESAAMAAKAWLFTAERPKTNR
jgi:quercetin dioxygenase-like cupin family protein